MKEEAYGPIHFTEKKFNKQMPMDHITHLKMFINVKILFVWGLSSHSRIFHLFGYITVNGEGLQILTYIYSAYVHLSEIGPVVLELNLF